MESFFDKTVVNDSTITHLKNVIFSNHEMNGKPENESLIRYEFRSNSETKDEYVLYYLNIFNKKASDNYYMMVNVKTKKIVSFGINPKKKN